jgi:hypothetical protein
LLLIICAAPSTAQEEAKARISSIEATLASKGYNFYLRNDLRHLYLGVDVKKSHEQCDIIFRHDLTNQYILDRLGADDTDPEKAAERLLKAADTYPEFAGLAASCRLAAADLTTDLRRRRELLEAVAGITGADLERHRQTALERLAFVDRPHSDSPWTIKVLVVNYFPLTADRQRLDIEVTSNVSAPLIEIEEKCQRQTREVIEALEEGSRFRPYRNTSAPKCLRYQVAGTVTYYEPVPHHPTKEKYADYNKIMERVDIRKWVLDKGVREVWIWAYHSPELGPVESNMASVHGNISNSWRDPEDLPLLKQTYTVYHYNYERETDMAVHNHLHQIEALLRHHGGDLWKLFEGERESWRCGNCHFPVNGVKDYDYDNKTVVESDIEDWRPEGKGAMQSMNCDRWDCNDLKWYVYWMQAIPGAANGLTYKGSKLSNWWEFIGDYDQAVRRKNKLTE